MEKLKYSIIYAVIRPEISEQLSIGLIIVDGDKVEVLYSKNKLKAMQNLFSDKEYRFISGVVSSMKRGKTVETVEDVNYLIRYSNNLIALSPLQSIDISPTEQNKKWLLANYVYNNKRQTA
jgi:hypothetical protein